MSRAGRGRGRREEGAGRPRGGGAGERRLCREWGGPGGPGSPHGGPVSSRVQPKGVTGFPCPPPPRREEPAERRPAGADPAAALLPGPRLRGRPGNRPSPALRPWSAVRAEGRRSKSDEGLAGKRAVTGDGLLRDAVCAERERCRLLGRPVRAFDPETVGGCLAPRSPTSAGQPRSRCRLSPPATATSHATTSPQRGKCSRWGKEGKKRGDSLRILRFGGVRRDGVGAACCTRAPPSPICPEASA